MHHRIKFLLIANVIFSFYAPVWCMHLTQAPKDVLFVIAHLLLNQEDEPFDYYNYASKENTHTQQTLNLLKKYQQNVTTDYIYFTRTCKRIYGLLHLENQLPDHLSWDVFIKSMDKYIQDETELLKMTSYHADTTENYSFEFYPFHKHIQWKLTCKFFRRSSQKPITKNALLERSFIDRQSPLWDALDFVKRNSVVGTVYVYSFQNLLDDNNNRYIQFLCIGSFNWLREGVPLSFVKEYFLNA